MIRREKIVAVDTEFMRETTYFAVLCLVQINVAGKCFVVDALAKDIDLGEFFEILGDKKITKVFHSCRQDLAVLEQMRVGVVFRNIMDTQMMASLAGVGYDLGYAKLVKIFLKKNLDKDWQRSDWEGRPLQKEQIKYAMIDVLYLPKIYQILHKKLVKEKKLVWLEEEMVCLVDKAIEDDIFKKFPFVGRGRNYQENIKLLVEWRDDFARRSNVPRSFVIKDKLLERIAYKNPRSVEELMSCEFETRISGLRREILNLIKDVNFEEEAVVLERKSFRMGEKQSKLYKVSRALLQKNAKEHNLSEQLVINQDDLRGIVMGNKKIEEVLRGWRFQVFGKDLEKLIK